MTGPKLIRWAGLSAVLAGLLFVAIQFVHPPDTLESVTTDAWVIVHVATLAMLVLFLAGITGIYARQVEEAGLLGLAGYVVLGLGLLITAAFAFVEAFVAPLVVAGDPSFVEGLLGLARGSGSDAGLGALPALWSVSGLFFPVGCLLLGMATWRARILPRWASGVFAFGLPVTLAVVSLLPYDLHRVGAVPIGAGLTWLGYALFTEKRRPGSEPAGIGSSRSGRTGTGSPR